MTNDKIIKYCEHCKKTVEPLLKDNSSLLEIEKSVGKSYECPECGEYIFDRDLFLSNSGEFVRKMYSEDIDTISEIRAVLEFLNKDGKLLDETVISHSESPIILTYIDDTEGKTVFSEIITGSAHQIYHSKSAVLSTIYKFLEIYKNFDDFDIEEKESFLESIKEFLDE